MAKKLTRFILIALVLGIIAGWAINYAIDDGTPASAERLKSIGWLFFDGRSVGGWILTACGALIILAGIIANLHIYLAPTSLFDTLVILGLLAGGIGVVARSLRAQP